MSLERLEVLATPIEQAVATASLRDCTPFVPHFAGPFGETLNSIIVLPRAAWSRAIGVTKGLDEKQMKSCSMVFLVFFALFSAVGVVKWFAQTRPYESMKVQIANLPLGTKFQRAKSQISSRGPEVSCSSVVECKQELKYYGRYTPNPIEKVRGPVLVYRMAGIDHIHCLYFDEQSKLVSVSESTLQLP